MYICSKTSAQLPHVAVSVTLFRPVYESSFGHQMRQTKRLTILVIMTTPRRSVVVEFYEYRTFAPPNICPSVTCRPLKITVANICLPPYLTNPYLNLTINTSSKQWQLFILRPQLGHQRRITKQSSVCFQVSLWLYEDWYLIVGNRLVITKTLTVCPVCIPGIFFGEDFPSPPKKLTPPKKRLPNCVL